MTTDPIKALVERARRQHVFPNNIIHIRKEFLDELIEALTPIAAGGSVVVPVAELQPFADLVSTKNDYDLSTDDEIIRSAGTYGRDYCHITVGDCRRLKDRLHRKG